MTFEEWWMLLKPAECDEVKQWFEEAWAVATKTEREECARECDAVASLRTHSLEFKFRLSAQECATNIRMRSNVEGDRGRACATSARPQCSTAREDK